VTNSLFVTEYNNLLNVLSNNIDKLKNKSILITGANGLIGSYTVRFLDYINKAKNLNLKIYAMSRSREKLQRCFGESTGINIVEQDLNNPININFHCDFIIHAASNAHPRAYSTDPVGTMKTNLFGTMNLLDYAKDNNAKFLYISSGEIYGNNIDRAFTEDDLGIVDTKLARACYPESKRAAETLCMAYSSQYGIEVNVARLCYVYGGTITDTNSRADAQFLRNAVEGNDIVMKSEGLQRRTYCYVADAVSAILTILLCGKSPEVYNVANPDSIVSVREYAQTLADVSGVTLKFELPDEIEAKGFSKPADSILDSTKLRSLGWKALYGIKEGLNNTFLIRKEK
jgi:nucleoside-diphosphate-sugar epimerase